MVRSLPSLMSLWCHSSSLSSHALHTRLCSLKGSFFSSCCYTLSLRRTTINRCRSAAVTDPLGFMLQCPFKASRWGNRVLINPWGQKEGKKTFSAANCVVNYAVWGVFQLPLCECHALSSNTRASFQLTPVLKV